ncbi:hypothetical protein AOQ84DRAFT_419184 [Glonium stellatum]|uniref:NACHT-NTPase and P-loop NTPases N-terminal domain-containing protein n=1 Tax=Glonium stellatum TaxID=574774 RepID=A0A8E2F8N1_9PEZI|nr:hypothetical protein AOQ84DRAFT_419184 [Glonium stellatum]
MSFGFAIGDFIAVMDLAWNLHQNCYKVLQDSPQEVKELSRDLATIYGVLKHIQEDWESSDSSIKAHGEGREKLLQTMVTNLNETLSSLQKLVSSFHPLASDASMRKQLREKLRWLSSQRKIGRIRQDITFHISSFNLILASMGNSSLQRIESGLQSMRLSSIQFFENSDIGSSLKPQRALQVEESYDEEESRKDNQSDCAVLQQSPPIQRPHDASEKSASRAVTQRLNTTTLPQQAVIALIIIGNCQNACYQFYRNNALWRTKFSSKDNARAPKLFELPDGQSPSHFECFDLAQWIAKIRHAWLSRHDQLDSCSYQAVRNPSKFTEAMQKAGVVPSLLLPWGGLDTENCEQVLEDAIIFCDHLNAWDSKARLQKLLANIRNTTTELDFNHLNPRSPPTIFTSPAAGSMTPA